jgi:site-specific recombinase XerD
MNNKHAQKYAGLHRTTLFPYVNKFLSVMRARGVYQPNTVDGVRSNLNDMAAEFGRRPLNRFGPQFIEDWMNRPDLGPSTRRTRLSNAKKFSEWMVEIGKVKMVATRQYPRIKLPRRVPVTCPEDDVAKLLDLVAGDRRATAMVWLMVGQGARCVEVSNLMMDDYDPRARMIRLRGKFDHERELPVTIECARALDAYIAEIGRVPGPMIRSLTNTYDGLTAATISDYMGRWMRAAGIKARNYDGKSAHGLRRTCASDVMDRTRDIYAVQAMLGHASIETTTIYLRPVSTDTLREAMEGRSYTASEPIPHQRVPVKALHSYRGKLSVVPEAG